MTTGTGKASSSTNVQDILRLKPQEAAEILEAIDAKTKDSVARERRKWPRVPYRAAPRVAVIIESERVGKRTYALIPRNISRVGMSLLHGKFVYDGTPCVAGLKALDGQLVPVRGKVTWCRLITGRIHEIGVQFEEPIDLDDFVPAGEELEPGS
ncbi:MAG: PilZ domain-containing protein [Planctomycetota bacterium]